MLSQRERTPSVTFFTDNDDLLGRTRGTSSAVDTVRIAWQKPMAVSAVGDRLLNSMKRTVKLPVQICEPPLPEQK